MRKLWISLMLLFVSVLVLSACSGGTPAASSPATAPEGNQPQQQPQMTHDAEPMVDTSYDIHFIDMILHHHEGVMSMAGQALRESPNVAQKHLAQQSMTTTQKEIDWLKAYRAKNHPNAGPMKDSMDTGAMNISTDNSKPFEQRYAEAMISHHQSSIQMANEALTKVGHEELKQFAQALLTVENAEVAQLQNYLQ